ncbi:MetQ/NlpA family ABC transporter substrate-binding protein [Desulfitobacterium metallireducens]|uniref:Lipoprotein n=1 Tax=Desulfitobacterium metallireducens DSM 15288 TaxID=871968 RepID=W0EB07_9FIRM|nr:MetQ/NlpA family ABC transporter substrate-binding protein [Desulfitobacterium metallireducens]AHF06409.1 ABC transporter substrate-binding protein [Desulfitobacterium metallireducens DSM 15288]
MFKSKRRLATLVLGSLVSLSLLVTGCGNNTANNAATGNTANSNKPVVLKVGATPKPHAEILEHIKPELAKEGIDLQIQVYNDYVVPNTALDAGEIDANFFQHQPYLDSFIKDRGMKLVSIGQVHLEPMGLYSKKTTKVDELKAGDTIAIPNDPSNGGRALVVLEKAGLIKLKDGVGVKATVQDIVSNPKEFKISTIDAAQLPRVLEDPKTAGAVINTNFALEGGLNPKDALTIEEAKDNPYSNIVAVKADRKDDPNLQKLMKALTSPDVKKFIEDKYQGSVIPSF